MQTGKLNQQKNVVIVKRVMVAETLKNIPHGQTVRFTRAELTNSEGSVAASIFRLNKKSKGPEFSYSVDENDGSFLISRK